MLHMFLLKQPCLRRGAPRVNTSLPSAGAERVWDAGRLPGVSAANAVNPASTAFIIFTLFIYL